MSAIPRIAAAVALGALALAVSRPTADAQPSGTGPVATPCFYLNDVDQLKADGARTLYARVSGRRYYRIDLRSECPGLQGNSEPPVLTSEPTSQVCGPMNLDIHVQGELCMPKSIVRLTDAEVAALPKSVKP